MCEQAPSDNTPAEDSKIDDNMKMRKIKSFVKRVGRMSERQKLALKQHWSQMGLECQDGLIDIKQTFDSTGAVTLEIGFGMGRSLVEQATSNPDTNYIGIEVHAPGVGACLAEAAGNSISNLRVYEHDAVEVLNDCIKDQSIDTLQLFFPDPWHKTKHNKRRIVQDEFVQKIRSKLKIGGVFHMATDWEDYAKHMLKVMSVAQGYENTSSTGDYVERPTWRPLTKFEQRGHRLGHGVWDLIFKRVD